MTNHGHDWPAIKAAYVEGRAQSMDGDPSERIWPTLGDVAEAFGVSPSRLGHKSAAEHWPEQREQFQTDVEQARRLLAVQERSAQSGNVDSQAMANTEGALALIGVRITHLVNGQRNLAPADQGAAGVSSTELANLGLATRRWLQVRDMVMGRPAEDFTDELTLERDLRVGEALVAAQLAAHVAARSAPDVDDLP
jgi:hypothetical protein